MANVRTKKVKDRRQLRFGHLHELVDDVEQFKGQVRGTGNWSPGQIVGHIARVIECSLDGFEVPNAPLIVRGILKMMRSSILNKPMKPGFKLPGKFSFLKPDPDITWEQAVGQLKKVVLRIETGQRMQHRSPVLGFLEHEEWIQLHCRHAEMHFSFLLPVESEMAAVES